MEIDHVIAVGLFILIFGFAIAFVSNHVTDIREIIKTDILKEKTSLFVESLSKNETLISPAYRVFVYVNNPNSSSINEIVSIDLERFGKNDPNSAYILDDSDNSYNYLVSGNRILFSSGIPASSGKWFTVYYDDDSNFPDRSSTISGNDTIVEKIFGPEQIYVVQHKRMEAFRTMNYGDAKKFYGMDFRIRIFTGNTTLMDYGSKEFGKQTVVAIKKPVLVQTSDARIVEGFLEVKAW